MSAKKDETAENWMKEASSRQGCTAEKDDTSEQVCMRVCLPFRSSKNWLLGGYLLGAISPKYIISRPRTVLREECHTIRYSRRDYPNPEFESTEAFSATVVAHQLAVMHVISDLFLFRASYSGI